MREDLERFVASLRIPADRKAVVLAELTDHVACATEAARREGRDPEAAARAALGDLEALRRSLEAIEPAFRVSRLHAFGRGVAASVIVAILIERAGSMAFGVVPALAVLAIAVAFSPPRTLELLRAEVRAPRAIGPAVVYLYTVMAIPMAIWIGMIVVRAFAGDFVVVQPWSAFTLCVAVYLLLFVEMFRARRRAAV